MKLELSPRRQSVMALGLFAVVLTVGVLIVIWPWWEARTMHAEQVSILKQQLHTMQSLIDATSKFEAEAKKLAANSSLRQLTFSAPQTALAVAELQSQVSQMMSSAPAAVTSSQVLPESREGELTKISVQLTFETDVKGLIKALYSIGNARPLLKIERITLKDPDGDWATAGDQAPVINKIVAEIAVSAFMRVE